MQLWKGFWMLFNEIFLTTFIPATLKCTPGGMTDGQAVSPYFEIGTYPSPENFKSVSACLT